MKSGTHTFLPTARVHFGAAALGKLEEEARPHGRAFIITGRSLNEKTDLIRRVESLLGSSHAGTFAGIGQHTPGGTVEKAAMKLAKSKGWISQRRSLLHLAPELQTALRNDELAVRTARSLAQVPPEAQVQAWAAEVPSEAHAES